MMMAKLITIGEALIDFMPEGKGKLTEIELFRRCAGGAPANVAASAVKLGVDSMIITKLGQDAFGDYLIAEMARAGISTEAVMRTNEANTALAFVSRTEDGERDFSFYRSPSADMLLSEAEIKPEWFEKGDILHFCSVNLVDAPCKKAHDRAIHIAREKGCLISFDVNLRFPLWDSVDELKRVVHEYIKKADIVKVSEEELEFLGEFISPCRIITEGKKGARLQRKDMNLYSKGYSVSPVDTTGAGDSFIGAFLASIVKLGGNLVNDEKTLRDVLNYCNAVAALVVSREGSLGIMPTEEEVITFMMHEIT